MPKRLPTLAAFVVALAGLAVAPAARAQEMSAADFMKAVNGDKDQTLSRDEIEAYARKKFAAIESDHDKTLDDKELKGRIGGAGIALADTDKDKTVDEKEFVAYADQLFEEANEKGKKTLSLAELETPGGKKLIMLLH